jgi:hypothetical protein
MVAVAVPVPATMFPARKSAMVAVAPRTTWTTLPSTAAFVADSWANCFWYWCWSFVAWIFAAATTAESVTELAGSVSPVGVTVPATNTSPEIVIT